MEVTVLVGNPKPRSRTREIAEAVAERVVARTGGRVAETIDLCEVSDAIFRWPDETMAALLSARRTPGLTIALELHYKAAAPLHVPLEFRAAIAHNDGAEVALRCVGTHDGHVFVEATGRFRLIDFRRFASDLDERAIASAPNDG